MKKLILLIGLSLFIGGCVSEKTTYSVTDKQNNTVSITHQYVSICKDVNIVDPNFIGPNGISIKAHKITSTSSWLDNVLLGIVSIFTLTI